MHDTRSTTTSTALLAGLFDPGNNAVWREFDRRYRPILTAFARRLGLTADDAAEAAQDTLARFVEEYRAGKYERSRGRLRAWLIGMAKTRIAQMKRIRQRRRERRGASVLIQLADPAELERIWEEERKLALLRQALLELRGQTRTSDKTLAAFEQYVLKRRPAKDVASDLGMTRQDVYMAKNRVAERLREITARLEPYFDDE